MEDQRHEAAVVQLSDYRRESGTHVPRRRIGTEGQRLEMIVQRAGWTAGLADLRVGAAEELAQSITRVAIYQIAWTLVVHAVEHGVSITLDDWGRVSRALSWEDADD